ncbi:FT-interacting protein 1-like protein [Tanacetum coccineum]
MMQRAPPHDDFSLKETNPHLGGRKMTSDKLKNTYGLVEPMQYLYVRVVKGRELPCKDAMGSYDSYAEVRLGNYTPRTRHFVNNSYPEWNQVYAFFKDRIRAIFFGVPECIRLEIGFDKLICELNAGGSEGVLKRMKRSRHGIRNALLLVAYEMRDLIPNDRIRFPEVLVKAVLGHQALRT